MNRDEFEAFNPIVTDRHGRQAACHYVYRYWNDLSPVGHQLLYIGYTHDFHRRDDSHRRRSRWHRQATRVDIEPYTSERAAKSAESAAIVAELPLYNTTYQDVGRWLEAHGDWMDFVEDRYSAANLATDRRCAQVMADIGLLIPARAVDFSGAARVDPNSAGIARQAHHPQADWSPIVDSKNGTAQ